MNQLIQEITTALQKSMSFENDFMPHLKASETIWKEDYPIAVVHSKSRIKDPSTAELFQQMGLLDDQGHTPDRYDAYSFTFISEKAPSALQSVKFIALTDEPKEAVSYAAKHPNDFWKKIQDVDHILSSFDCTFFNAEDEHCKVEFELREIIRKRKEVHALKNIGFIWMAVTKNDVSEVFRHYFQDDYIFLDGQYHLGWSETLKEINMRHFVCPPK